MADLRLTLAQSSSVLCACVLLLGCGDSHTRDDAGRDVDSGSSVDAGSVDSGTVDAGDRVDAGVDAGGPRNVCDADDISVEICPPFDCDEPPLWYWDGDRCISLECGACVGDGCGGGTVAREACEAAHATCEPTLCRSTGGTWRWWDELCGHYSCGEPPPAICESGEPACDCGYGRNFVPGVGCELDSACPEIDPLPEAELCAATGGEMLNTCCPSECGVPCPLFCDALACNCGPLEIFDSIRGCTSGARCMERMPGESCHAGARCDGGTICCDSCGGAGCAGDPRCVSPTCDDDPLIDTCGNDSRAP